jgi:SulP family sulfate permease
MALPEAKPARHHGWAHFLLAWLPFLRWRQRVTPQTLRADFMAGLTGAIVVLPQGVAFATIAGMPPEYGLYAGMVPAIIAALFGSSWHLVSGPTTAASIVLFSILSPHAAPFSPEYAQLAITLTFMVGIVQLVMGFMRLGTLVNFISHSVVIGFTAGAAILIAANQIKNFFGIAVEQGSSFIHTIHTLFTHLQDINPYVFAVAAATLLTGIATRRWLPKLPYMIVAMIAGSVLGFFLSQRFGLDTTGIKTVGALPASLPPLSAPQLSLQNLQILGSGVIAVTLLALTEAISIARALAARSGQAVDGNQEFIGQGLSNLGGSFFSGYVATGSFNRSGLNYSAGAQTPLAAVISGLLLMLLVVLVAPLAAYLPNAAMAGILFLVAWGLIDFHHIHQILRASKAESMIMVSTFLATLFLNLEEAIIIGVMLSLGIYLSRTSRPKILARVPDPALPNRKFNDVSETRPECPQFGFVRIDGSVFFAASSHIQTKLEQHKNGRTHQKYLAVIATGINFIDISGAELLASEAKKRKAEGGGLYLIRAKEQIKEFLRRSDCMEEIGENHFFHSKSEVIREVFKRIDPAICARCSRRIFTECATMPRPESTDSVSPILEK